MWEHTISKSSEDDDREYCLSNADGEDEDCVVEPHFDLFGL